ENPDYRASYQIDHPAVVCKTDPPVDPPVVDPPTVEPSVVLPPAAASPTSTVTPRVLAETGSDTGTGLLVATALVLLGSALAVVSHRRTADQH
ncbi:MAG: LPXTG cell wall anchor domain-containing protein, partial [Cellulomonas sp.]|nr:LPXTG cell wall anchor domain-containing protein [Cellulomonas sp.]